MKGGGLFNVEVRRRGKFERLATRPLPFGKALAAGRANVERTAAASFRILPEGGRKPVSRPVGVNLPGSFKESKRERGVYIQQPRFRISSRGEKTEITLKGIAANRTGGIFGKKRRMRL